jgi:S-adenosylmethionine:tRNA ribosyltransferase-isomerase
VNYTLSDFDYHLPEELIAQSPAHPRDHARLLVFDRSTGTITDDYFYNLHEYLPANSSLVVNNSKVEKCRLLFDEGRIEIFVVNTRNNDTVEALVRPGKKFREGRIIELEKGIKAEVLHVAEDGLRTLKLTPALDASVYEPIMHTPFPPYIAQNEELSDEYQTVYAKDLGSKAAPTAGLHFTDSLLRKIEEKGIPRLEVTLHVGLGTFHPVKTENIEEHDMHSEWYRIDAETAEGLNRAGHVTAVGTTSVRVLEAAWKEEGYQAEMGETDIYIMPGYAYKNVDALITNFHLPKSTLLMLVGAFMGMDDMWRVYHHAIEERYRFYSFGDGMLIL